MRILTDKEKHIIDSIISCHDADPMQYVLTNAYNDIFESFPIKLRWDKDKADLTYYYDDNQWKMDDSARFLTEVESLLLDRGELLRFLIEEKHIVLVEQKDNDNPDTFSLYPNLNKKNSISYDIDISSVLIFKQSFKRIIITKRLRNYQKNNYLSDNELLYNKILEQTKLTSVQVDNTKKLVSSARKQTKEAILQTEQAQVQTTLAKEQREQAIAQTQEAKKQTGEAQIQTKEAQKQTCWAIGATFFAFLTFIFALWQMKSEDTIKSSTQKSLSDQMVLINDSIDGLDNDSVQNRNIVSKTTNDSIITQHNNAK